jgi:hypothetical protein
MSHGSLLGKDGSANARLKDRLDELKAEECDSLTENMEIGRQKGDAAQRKANMSSIVDIATEARAIQDYLSRAAYGSLGKGTCPMQQGQQQKPQQQQLQQQLQQQRPHSSLNIMQRSGGAQSSLHTPSSADVSKGGKDMEDNKASSFCT